MVFLFLHTRSGLRHTAPAVSAVQSLLCGCPHSGVARYLRSSGKQKERAVGSPQNRLRHAYGRCGLRRDGDRFAVYRGNIGIGFPQLADLDLSAPHFRRAAAFPYGNLLCQQSSSSEAQGFDDGRMVCRDCRRQLSRFHPNDALGQDTYGCTLGHSRSHLSPLGSVHILDHEETGGRDIRYSGFGKGRGSLRGRSIISEAIRECVCSERHTLYLNPSCGLTDMTV